MTLTDKALATCQCGTKKTITKRCLMQNINKYGKYVCLRCLIKKRGSANGKAMKHLIRQQYGNLNNDDIVVKCQICQNISHIKYKSLKAWQRRHSFADYICGPCLNKSQDRTNSKSDEYKSKCSERSKRYWQNPEYRNKLLKHLAEVRSLGPGPSSLEMAVWKLLDDLGVPFTSARDGKSYTLGYWSFDIFIDQAYRSGSKHLLLEVDGEYRHSRQDVINYDKAKDTYVTKYHQDHELQRILEHEFLVPGILKTRILELLGRSLPTPKPINLNDVIIEEIGFEEATAFLGAYHYLGYVNKRGIVIGCKLNHELIGVVLFAGLTRKQSGEKINIPVKKCRELIRFCLSPRIHNKNLASYFLSRSLRIIKLLIPDLMAIVTFADATAGHIGTIYKATNFRYLGEVVESYAYVNKDGYVMHKKTMWNHASKNHMTEQQMAQKSGYRKIKSLKKYKYVFEYK